MNYRYLWVKYVSHDLKITYFNIVVMLMEKNALAKQGTHVLSRTCIREPLYLRIWETFEIVTPVVNLCLGGIPPNVILLCFQKINNHV